MVIPNYILAKIRSISPLAFQREVIIKDDLRSIKSFQLWLIIIYLLGIVVIPFWVSINGGLYSSIETDQG